MNPPETKKILALCDLDGTLTCRDTMWDFLLFAVGPFHFFLGCLKAFPFLLWHYLIRRNETKAKEFLLTLFLGNQEKMALEKLADRYITRLQSLLRISLWKKIMDIKSNGGRVVIVTASLDLWVEPWCRRNGMDLISSRAQWSEGRFTGRLAGANCRGNEKVRRIQEAIPLAEYDEILAWGDSPSDVPMLHLAHRSWYKGKPFKGSTP
ncbi:MAG: haloacid dehalogenase-like hydrolase [Flavobacteriales bacterium]|nr:haloacid dehalogenase-like hydrolase [Flavobacteriales bacterium]MCX7769062.1 haloacid dehalogenase-like hydrolase [Flavobacteriales bacterium]MDW8410337.1 HAD family hydrolase [Flavobacteriales bacterium]